MRLFLLAIVSLLFLACEREPSAPTADGSSTPAFDFLNGPSEPGHSIVYRTENQGVWFWDTVDPSQDLVVRHYSAVDLSVCGGTESFMVVETQWVYAPPATVRLSMAGETPVYVYRLSEVPPPPLFGTISPEFCSDLVNKWIYRGTHNYVSHDNDFDLSGVRINMVSWTATGTLFDRAGNRHAYHEAEVSSDRPGSAEPPGPLAHYWVRYTLSIN